MSATLVSTASLVWPACSVPPVSFLDGIGALELLLIAVVGLLLFGGKGLPDMARTIGKVVREFKKATQGVEDEVRRVMHDEPAPPPRPHTRPPARPRPHPQPQSPPKAAVADAPQGTDAPAVPTPSTPTSPPRHPPSSS